MVVRYELKIPSLEITFRHHSASLVMLNSYPRDGLVNPHLITIKDSYILAPVSDAEMPVVYARNVFSCIPDRNFRITDFLHTRQEFLHYWPPTGISASLTGARKCRLTCGCKTTLSHDNMTSILTFWCHFTSFSAKRFDVNISDRSRTRTFLIRHVFTFVTHFHIKRHLIHLWRFLHLRFLQFARKRNNWWIILVCHNFGTIVNLEAW